MFERLLNGQMRLLLGENAREHSHPKLLTLREWLDHAEDTGLDFDALDREFGGLVQFFQHEEDYRKSINLVEGCNKLFEIYFDFAKPAPPYQLYEDGLRPPWRKEPIYAIPDFAFALYKLLADKWTLDCFMPGQGLPHRAELHLNTWQASKISWIYTEFDMVFSSHAKPYTWQESTIAISDERYCSMSACL